jgi:hypothetical protein
VPHHAHLVQAGLAVEQHQVAVLQLPLHLVTNLSAGSSSSNGRCKISKRCTAKGVKSEDNIDLSPTTCNLSAGRDVCDIKEWSLLACVRAATFNHKHKFQRQWPSAAVALMN